MGDWADMHSDYDFDFDRVEFKYARDVQNANWLQKNGDAIKVGDMTDKHLLNAYKMSNDERLFAEMVVRLFAERVQK